LHPTTQIKKIPTTSKIWIIKTGFPFGNRGNPSKTFPKIMKSISIMNNMNIVKIPLLERIY
jgi:hypothetical protein